MIDRLTKKIIWSLIIVSLILTIMLLILYFLGLQEKRKQQNQAPTIGSWIVMPKQDYSGLTLVTVQDGKTLDREFYQSVKLDQGYEAISSKYGPVTGSLSNKFIIFNLPYSDRNELTDEILVNYEVSQPFSEIYYCGDIGYPLTVAKANQIIDFTGLENVCRQINGFLF